MDGARRRRAGARPSSRLLPAGTTLRAGEDAVFEVVAALPDDVTTSRYDHSASRRWSLHASLRTASGATWTRELPVFVVAARAASPAHVS